MKIRKPIAVFVALFAAIQALIVLSVVRDDRLGRESLAVLKSPILWLSSLGELYVQNFYPLGLYTAASILLLLIILGDTAQLRSHRSLCFSIGIAIMAQLVLVDRQLADRVAGMLGWYGPDYREPVFKYDDVVSLSLGLAGYAVAILLAVRAITLHRRGWEFPFRSTENPGWSWFECACLVVIVSIGAVMRMYALNRLVDYFEGELSPYSAAATSLKGMFVANKGINGPWAPLGILYYVPIYLVTHVFGTTLLSLRLSSAIVGVLTIVVVYLLARKLSGRAGGLFAAAIFSLNCLHIGWSRTDIHPHGVTAWPVMLLCFALIVAHETRKLVWGVIVALLMGLTWHQYPSGQSGVAIPFFAGALFLVVNRWQKPLTWPQVVCVIFGLVLWFAGLPVSYYIADGTWTVMNPFNLTGPRALWGGEQGSRPVQETIMLVFSSSVRHVWEILQGIFYHVPKLFHQEWVPALHGLYPRSVAWLEVPLVVIGLTYVVIHIRQFESAIMLSWIVTAILPAILSESSWLKRFSTLFPCLNIFAGIGFMCLMQCVYYNRGRVSRYLVCMIASTGLFLYVGFTSYIWFSGRFMKYGESPEIENVRMMQSWIKPGTIVIAYMNDGYDQGKYLYLLLDHLTAANNRPNALMFSPPELGEQLIQDPRSAMTYAPQKWAYQWTKLRDQVSEMAAYQKWKDVVFIIQSGTPSTPINQEIISKARARCSRPEIKRTESRGSAWMILSLVRCDLADLQ